MFDWREFLSLAESLADGALGTSLTVIRDEAAYRSAVSRAYYAAFGHARAYASQHFGFIPTNAPNDHQRLARHFQAHNMFLVYWNLGKLRDRRNLCDYEDVVPDLGAEVQDALTEAAFVIGAL